MELDVRGTLYQEAVVSRLLVDLAAEHHDLELFVAALDDQEWHRPSAAEGWMISDVVSHLEYYDRAATVALRAPGTFATAWLDPALNVRGADIELGRQVQPGELLTRWREARAALLDAAASVDPAGRAPWYGPSMSVPSFLSARLMETWAHGVDISDALRRPPVATARLWHVCDLGVRARPYALELNGHRAARGDLRVEVTAPDGSTWAWGSPDAADRITGPAADLALVVTRRRLPADTALTVQGPEAKTWMDVAQAFAGPAGPAPKPGRGRH
jgi:uncharacterized protein (TIGR03084 family)